jgi:hypothetical protein
MPNFTKPPDSEGPLRWNAGPPYIATVRDMYRLAVRWTELAPQVLRVHDHLFAGKYVERDYIRDGCDIVKTHTCTRPHRAV